MPITDAVTEPNVKILEQLLMCPICKSNCGEQHKDNCKLKICSTCYELYPCKYSREEEPITFYTNDKGLRERIYNHMPFSVLGINDILFLFIDSVKKIEEIKQMSLSLQGSPSIYTLIKTIKNDVDFISLICKTTRENIFILSEEVKKPCKPWYTKILNRKNNE